MDSERSMVSRINGILEGILHNPLFEYLRSMKSAFLVGGAVRDFLFGRNIVDYDFILHENEFESARDYVSKKGFNYFLLNSGKLQLLRVIFEGYTFDLAKYYGDINEDIQRRDFTINSICLSLSEGGVFFANGALDDINNRILRTISSSSIPQDPVRIVRAFRFSSDLSLKIEPCTKAQITSNLSLLLTAKKERVREELKKVFKLDATKTLDAIEQVFGRSLDEEKRRLEIAFKIDSLQREVNRGVRYFDLLSVAILSATMPEIGACFTGREKRILTAVLSSQFGESFEERFTLFVESRDRLVPVMVALLKAPVDSARSFAIRYLDWLRIRPSGAEILQVVRQKKVLPEQAKFMILRERCRKHEV